MNPGSATQRPVPRTLERTQPLESPSAISDSEFWADRQRAFLEFLDRANELAYAISQEELLHQALGLILEAAQAESAIYFRLDGETDELVVSAVNGDEQSEHLVGLRFKRREDVLKDYPTCG